MDGLSDILSNLGGGNGGSLLDKLSGLLGGGGGGSLLDKLGGLLGGGDNAEGGSLLDQLGDLLGGGDGGSLLDKLGGLLGGDSADGGLLDKLKDLVSGGEDAGQSTPDTGAGESGSTAVEDTVLGDVVAPENGAGSAATDEPGWHINPPTNTTGDPNQPLTLPPTHIDPQTGLQVIDPLIGGTEPGDAGDAADNAQGAYPDYILELPQRVPEDSSADGGNADPTAGEVINAAVQQRLLFESQQITEDLM